MSNEMYDVVVVGGGSSGLYGAYSLAEAGRSVAIIEARREIGQGVVCTGVVGEEALDLVPETRRQVIGEIEALRFHSPLGSVIDYRHPATMAYVVDRGEFNWMIAKKAVARGAELHLGSRVEGIRVDGQKAELHLAREEGEGATISARLVILATGVNFSLHRAMGLGVAKGFTYGGQVVASMNGSGPTSLYVGNRFAPGGFGWVVPVEGGRAKIGLSVQGDPNRHLGLLLRKLDQSVPGFRACSAPAFKPIVQGMVSPSYSDRVLAIGEAAGQVKTTTGGGIYYGLLGAAMAAQVVIQALREDRLDGERLSEYERLWRGKLGREIEQGLFFRKLMTHLSDRQIEALFGYVSRDGVLELVREWGRFDWHAPLVSILLDKLPFPSGLGSR